MPERVSPERSAHPVLFLILFLPLGVSNGYVVVTLAYLMAAAGIGVDAIATLAAWSLAPQTWKVLGGPLVDTTLTNKAWYAISAVVTGLLMTATAIIPLSAATIGLITILVFIFSTATGFNALAADSIMAHATVPEEKGRAGGWSQAGNLGGSGIGGGLGLWLSQHGSPGWFQHAGHWLAQHTAIGGFADAGLWASQHITAGTMAGGSLGILVALSALVLPLVHEPPDEHPDHSFAQSIVSVGKDAWSLMRSRMGLLAIVAMSLPISVGAMTNLWSAVAGDWRASADWVALVNGALGGVISMFGCIIGGWLCDKMDRKLAFNLFSLIVCVCALAMAIAPRTQQMFIVFVCVYQFLTGLCYAAFGAVVLEAIGKGAAATKYNLLASLANVPIIYLTKIDGWAHSAWGATGMLLTEAAVPVLGTLIFVVFAVVTRPLYKNRAAAS